MKRFYPVTLSFLIVIFTLNLAQAQLFEDFETGEKTFYAGASVELASGDWYFEEALLGNLANDKYNGDQGVRIDRRDGVPAYIEMQFDKLNGADEISFWFANYGSSSGNTLQVQYSTDGGSSWTDIGEPLEASGSLEEVTLSVQVEGDIRFKFVGGGSERLNIDDVRITDYIQPQEDPTINVSVDEEVVTDSSAVQFASTIADRDKTKTISIKNVGNDTLEISGATIGGQPFAISSLTDSLLAFNETTELTLTFAPQAEGNFQDTLRIASNAANAMPFLLSVSGEGLSSDTPISIAEARQQPQGETVTVTGWVTVTDEFQGPVYFQDETGGIAWFNSNLMRGDNGFALDVARGDSIVLTGELGEFNDLIQIVGNEIEYEFYPEGNKDIQPHPITVDGLNSGNYEGQLVAMDVEVDHSGAFQSTEYEISDNTGTGILYINDDTEIIGATAPQGETTIVGVVGIFAGTYQLLPRDLNDIDAKEVEIPGEDVSKDHTLDVVTWNIEWFGSVNNGPDDEDVQLQNVVTVLDSIDADVYAFQEIASSSRFAELISQMEGYGGFEAGFSQSQKTAYLFKRSTIDSLDSGLITAGMIQSNWAGGRFPLLFRFNATINNEVREIYSYNMHMKAFDDQDSYSQRYNASRELKTYLDNDRTSENVLLLGDFNDQMTTSITSGEESPYKNFVDDTEYSVISLSLEQGGYTSYSSVSMIDHIIMTAELSDEYFDGTERVENPSYIGSYLSSTSDHYPVWTRFQWGDPVDREDDSFGLPKSVSLSQNYPNPFNPSTVISYQLSVNSLVRLEVYDMMGRKVVTLLDNKRQEAGSHSVTFDASGLSSGVYIYRLSLGNGQNLSRKMILVK